MPAVRWRPETGFAHEWEGACQAIDLGVGGFIVFGGTVEGVRRFTSEVTRYAGRPLLIGADLERGAGQQIEGLSEFPPPGALASLDDPTAIQAAARTTAIEARSVGINWVFAPVADLDIEPENPIVQSRSFGANPELVARCVRLWVESCQAAGALACAKHYPGHGRTTTDSHAGLPRVEVSRDALELDARPFGAAIAGGVASVMTAHVAFPVLDPAGTPATFSAPILQRLRAAGFTGLIVTDAMIMEGAKRGSEADAAVEILRAGVDLLLYPQDPPATIAGLVKGVRSGRLGTARMAESFARYETALMLATRIAQPPSPDTAVSADIADRLLTRGLIRGSRPGLRAPLDLTIIDDDIGGPYPPSPGVILPDQLEAAGVPLGKGGSRVVVVFAEPRGWKSRAGLSEEAMQRLSAAAPAADLVVMFAHPRVAEVVPGHAPVVVAWHRQKLMQCAVARWIKTLLA